MLQWEQAAIGSIDASRLEEPIASRMLAIVNTCMFDAWAAYDDKAIGTQLAGALRRPTAEHIQSNKERAVSYAAYRALIDLIPGSTNTFYKPIMLSHGYDPEDRSVDIETPAGIGNVACLAVLEFRHHDRSNQLGDLANPAGAHREILKNGAYDDWTDYVPVNSPNTVPPRIPVSTPLNPDHWQPLTYTGSTGELVVQMFHGAQWGRVIPFATVNSGEQSAEINPAPYRYRSSDFEKDSEYLVQTAAHLTEQQKVIAAYWSSWPGHWSPAEQWLLFAPAVLSRHQPSLDDDIKLYFLMSNAFLDANIAAWNAKRIYDSSRPLTGINLLFMGKKIQAWGGPGKGIVESDGSKWIPYQAMTSPTPPSPDAVSSESAESAAAARTFQLWTQSDGLGYSVRIMAGSSFIEPGIVPAHDVTLAWPTFSEAEKEAGNACILSGIDFPQAVTAGRALGKAVADRVWAKATRLFDGSALRGPDGAPRPAGAVR